MKAVLTSATTPATRRRPAHHAPARARWRASREQQGDEAPHRQDGRYPGPVPEPGQQIGRGARVGVAERDLPVERVRDLTERKEERRDAEQPPDRIAGTPRRHDRPHQGERQEHDRLDECEGDVDLRHPIVDCRPGGAEIDRTRGLGIGDREDRGSQDERSGDREHRPGDQGSAATAHRPVSRSQSETCAGRMVSAHHATQLAAERRRDRPRSRSRAAEALERPLAASYLRR